MAATSVTLQMPSVGRIVHFYKNYGPNEKPLPALVGDVYNRQDPDSDLDLFVFDKEWETHVVFAARVACGEHQAIRGTAYWVWPPYVAPLTVGMLFDKPLAGKGEAKDA